MDLIEDIKDYFDSLELLDILAECVFNPTPERLKTRVGRYKSNFKTSIYAIIYFICGISDVLDGMVARKMNLVSKKG